MWRRQTEKEEDVGEEAREREHQAEKHSG